MDARQLWDMNGLAENRMHWADQAAAADAFIFVVDANDSAAFVEVSTPCNHHNSTR